MLGLARPADGAAHLRRNWAAWSWVSSASALNLLSLIATLREEGRLPIRSVQWYLDTVHQLRLSVGAIVSAIHQTAQQAQPAVAAILDRIRASPVVHADETGWRQSGANGYVWTFSTPTERYFLRRGRGKAVVDEALGESFSGVLVSDFYAAYHHYDGPKQRCWAHLLRDIHDQRTRYPKDAALARWAAAVHQLYVAAKACNHHEPWQRRVAQLAWERKLLAICRPFVADPSAVQAKLCRRIERFIKELFVFVAEPDVPADNNPAERSLRHLVISRKVSGGTRSEQGTESKMTLASLFGTWRAQGLNPLAACRQLLVPLDSELLQAPLTLAVYDVLNEASVNALLSVKSEHWSYEGEWRLIPELNETIGTGAVDGLGYSINLLRVPNEAVVSVYHTERAKPKLTEEVVDRISNSNNRYGARRLTKLVPARTGYGYEDA